MIPESLKNCLSILTFPRKLYALATEPAVKSIRWGYNGFTVIFYMNILKKELCNPHLINVTKFEDLIPLLLDYDFRRVKPQRKLSTRVNAVLCLGLGTRMAYGFGLGHLVG
ncbi:hypothetical protein TNCV_2001171 [Trichonephila clavipes]|nr:hypothetical protein TNCV_2001171 [Trichonephila clavipes]